MSVQGFAKDPQTRYILKLLVSFLTSSHNDLSVSKDTTSDSRKNWQPKATKRCDKVMQLQPVIGLNQPLTKEQAPAWSSQYSKQCGSLKLLWVQTKQPFTAKRMLKCWLGWFRNSRSMPATPASRESTKMLCGQLQVVKAALPSENGFLLTPTQPTSPHLLHRLSTGLAMHPHTCMIRGVMLPVHVLTPYRRHQGDILILTAGRNEKG